MDSTTSSEREEKVDNNLSVMIKKDGIQNYSFNDVSKIDQSTNFNKPTREFKTILLGAPNVGKTALLKRFIIDFYSEQKQLTIKIESESKNMCLNQNMLAKIVIYDTCGNENSMSDIIKCFKEVNGAILIFDISEKETFNCMNTWINLIKKHDVNQRISCILVGAKSDLEKKVDQSDINKFLYENKDIDYVEISNKIGTNVDMVFDKLLKKMNSCQPIPEKEIEEEEDDHRNANDHLVDEVLDNDLSQHLVIVEKQIINDSEKNGIKLSQNKNKNSFCCC